mgnify:CR=1 FL=1
MLLYDMFTVQVVRDCIEEVSSRLDVVDQVEVDEYTMFLRTRDGSFSRLRSEEYILDVTAELARNRKDFDLVFQRTVWYFPFKSSDNLLYNELMYFQVSAVDFHTIHIALSFFICPKF